MNVLLVRHVVVVHGTQIPTSTPMWGPNINIRTTNSLVLVPNGNVAAEVHRSEVPANSTTAESMCELLYDTMTESQNQLF
jgi:hypothetical protein